MVADASDAAWWTSDTLWSENKSNGKTFLISTYYHIRVSYKNIYCFKIPVERNDSLLFLNWDNPENSNQIYKTHFSLHFDLQHSSFYE